jgi:hypothetical protein
LVLTGSRSALIIDLIPGGKVLSIGRATPKSESFPEGS